MFFKLKLFEEYPELGGVIGADNLPYFILLDLAKFLGYKNPGSAIHGNPYKQYQSTVHDVISPHTTVDRSNGKRRVITYQELENCMKRKRDFNGLNQFVFRFQISPLAEPIPDHTKRVDLLNNAMVLRLDYTKPFNQCIAGAMTAAKWLTQYTWINADKQQKMIDSPAIPHALPFQTPSIKVPEKRPISNSDVDDPCVSSSMSPSLKSSNEDLIPRRKIFCGNTHSASQNYPLLQALMTQPSTSTTTGPALQGVQNRPSAGLFTTFIETRATQTPTTAFPLRDNYMVQSPAPVEPCTVSLPRYVPVPVNEEYLVEAPASVRPYYQPAEEEKSDCIPKKSATRSDEMHFSRPLHPGNSYGEPMTEKEQERLTEIITGTDWMPRNKRRADSPFSNDDEEDLDKDGSVNNATFSVQTNRRKQSLPKRMTVDQDIELPKININIGEKTYMLGISLRLEERV